MSNNTFIFKDWFNSYLERKRCRLSDRGTGGGHPLIYLSCKGNSIGMSAGCSCFSSGDSAANTHTIIKEDITRIEDEIILCTNGKIIYKIKRYRTTFYNDSGYYDCACGSAGYELIDEIDITNSIIPYLENGKMEEIIGEAVKTAACNLKAIIDNNC